jgi:hypothetical protein
VKAARNLKAISKLLLILLLLLATIIGSILSYLLLAGYYLNLDIKVPENTTLSVVDVGLTMQNAETFNITVLNPTYSPTEAKITEISVATENDEIHTIMNVKPELPYRLDKGQEQTFVCDWNWGDYAGETLKVIIVAEDGSGAVYEIETATVGLEISSAIFTTSDTQHFNVTVKNPAASASDLHVTKITVTMENGTEVNIREANPTIPRILPIDTSTTFVCSWDWTYYRGMNATINVYTSQGYLFHRTETTPKPAQLSITDAIFDPSTLSSFSITVKNSENSIVAANLSTVEIRFTDQTTQEVSVESPPDLPYTLPIGDSVTLKCLWNWSGHREETVVIYVKTPEGYLGYKQQTLP